MIPIWFTIWMIASFTWLFYESDWMRVRLLTGYSRHKPTFESTFDVIHWSRDYQAAPIIFDETPKFVTLGESDIILSPGITEPIPGWSWIESRQHPIPIYKMEITAWGCHHTIILCNTSNGKSNLVKDVCRVAFKTNKEERKQITQQNKALRLARA